MQIDAKSVSVRLGAITALDGVDFHAATGEMIGLIGPNGSGKTTLLRVIANLLRPDRAVAPDRLSGARR
jgi:ABC-type multidrug transport system ATPase subunit